MTLPPSRAKDAAATTVAKTIVFDDVLDHRQVVFQRDACGMYQEGQPQQRTQQTKQTPQRPHGDPPVQRRSVQFVPGDEDELRDHEHQRTLPKTPYPITENPMDSSSTPPSSSPSRKTSSPSTHDTSARRSPSASPLHLPHPPTDGMCHQFSVSPPHSLSSTSSASLKGMPTSGLDKDTLNMAFEKLVNT
ncbi:hypothetical protein BGZ73_005998 [Actinomortierella ambigua]|nr:hypothetical protein BGZ73_005998 [Actinomortierella ambigua]